MKQACGNYIIMKDRYTRMGFLYGHMREASSLNIGDNVQIGTYVGHEGETGHATGIHLHLMQQYMGNSDTWDFNKTIAELENPATFLGIPNQVGISAIYNGVVPPPYINIKKKKFPWVIYANIIRKKYLTK